VEIPRWFCPDESCQTWTVIAHDRDPVSLAFGAGGPGVAALATGRAGLPRLKDHDFAGYLDPSTDSGRTLAAWLEKDFWK
jgi:hypothetical protein